VEEGGKNIVRVLCLHLWKCYNETHFKNCKKDKKGWVGEEG
jgi:hypothetical protein